jgi:hypothetical protein
MKKELIQMKISLDGIKPEIWRRFIVDSSISLDDFHDIIQIVMGWTNSHLYGFSISGVEYMPSDDDCEQDAEDTQGVTLKKLKLRKNDKIRYVYDFGDDWGHTIKIENVFTPEEEVITPVCLDGARNCPPEDCGSIPGYEDIIHAMKKPTTKAAKEFIEWLGEKYDAELFDCDEINTVFKPKKTKKKK